MVVTPPGDRRGYSYVICPVAGQPYKTHETMHLQNAWALDCSTHADRLVYEGAANFHRIETAYQPWQAENKFVPSDTMYTSCARSTVYASQPTVRYLEFWHSGFLLDPSSSVDEARTFCNGVAMARQNYLDNGVVPSAGHGWGTNVYECDANCGAYTCAAATA